MENFENWNKKVRKKNLNDNLNSNENTNSTQRDYDKEPLIIKSYERFFVTNLVPFCMFMFCSFVFLFGDLFDTETTQLKKEIDYKIGFSIIFFEIIYLFISYYHYVIKNKFEIYLTNKSIDFYKNGVLERKIYHNDFKSSIVKTFWQNSSKSDLNSFWDILFLPCNLILMIVFGWLAVIFKFLFHIIFGGNPKYFTALPSIALMRPQYPNFVYHAWIIAGKNYLVYIIKRQDYLDLKEYFLQTNDINIDYIEKSYFI